MSSGILAALPNLRSNREAGDFLQRNHCGSGADRSILRKVWRSKSGATSAAHTFAFHIWERFSHGLQLGFLETFEAEFAELPAQPPQDAAFPCEPHHVLH